MAAFVGYLVQSNGIKLPWEAFPGAGAVTTLSPPEQWDAMPLAAKLQIVFGVGALELYSEHGFVLKNAGQAHYMRGGKPGFFPPFDSLWHPLPLNLYDPFGMSAGMSEEKKAKGLIKELNNGRLAMIGIFGFLSEQAVPGSVPFGPSLPAYSGDVMIPF